MSGTCGTALVDHPLGYRPSATGVAGVGTDSDPRNSPSRGSSPSFRHSSAAELVIMLTGAPRAGQPITVGRQPITGGGQLSNILWRPNTRAGQHSKIDENYRVC